MSAPADPSTMCIQGGRATLHPTLNIVVCTAACGRLRQQIDTLSSDFLTGWARRERSDGGEVCKGCRTARTVDQETSS